MTAINATTPAPNDLDEAILTVLIRVEPTLSRQSLLEAVHATGTTKPKRGARSC